MDARRQVLQGAAEIRPGIDWPDRHIHLRLRWLMVLSPAWFTSVAAAFNGGAFILRTFKMYGPAVLCGILAAPSVIWWLSTATARIPDREMMDVGLDLRLPNYVSGIMASGWWVVFITMLGDDATAFASLVFGVFYLTASPGFPPRRSYVWTAAL